MARIDKYDGKVGGFRAKLGFQPVASEVGDVIAVTINGSGNAIKAGTANADGVICLVSLLGQGEQVDVMTSGEIVDVSPANDNITGVAAGAKVYAGAAGAINTTAPAAGVNGVQIGKFVEAWRLIVRVDNVQG